MFGVMTPLLERTCFSFGALALAWFVGGALFTVLRGGYKWYAYLFFF